MSQLIPPHSHSAEQAVLGAILQDNACFDDVSEILCQEDFYNALHRDIFAAIREDLKKVKTVDVVTLAKHEGVDLSYCIELNKNCPSLKNVRIYAQSVKDKSIQRQLIGASFDIQEAAYQQPESIQKLVSDSERILSQVTNKLAVSTQDNSASAVLKQTYTRMKEMVESDGSLVGISTGIPKIDQMINGLKKGTMILLAARPAMGKTTLALNMFEHEAMNGGYPLAFSIEMPAYQLMNKIIASNGNVPLPAILNPKSLTDYQWAGVNDSMKRIKSTNMEIIDNGDMTTDLIRLECRKYLRKHGKLTLILVDYLQLIRGNTKENRTQEISGISRDLKSIAKEFNCPVLALSQLSRKLEERANKRPVNADLRESGQLEQDAEEIIFIHREDEYPDSDDVNDGLAELIISKCRMGQKGTVITQFNGPLSRFDETNRVVTLPSKKKSYSERFSA